MCLAQGHKAVMPVRLEMGDLVNGLFEPRRRACISGKPYRHLLSLKPSIMSSAEIVLKPI